MSKQRKAALVALASLTLIGIWVDVTGYLDVFSDPTTTDAARETSRYACYLGRIFVATLFLAVPKFFDVTLGRSIPLAFACMLGGTLLYSFSFGQSLFDTVVVAAIGSALIGFGHVWTVSLVYAYLARISTRHEALRVLVAAQIIERLAVEMLYLALPSMALAVGSQFLPAAALGLLWLAGEKTVKYRPLSNARPPLRGSVEQRYYGALCIMAGIGLVACGAMSSAGIWGNAGSGQFSGTAPSLMLAAVECAFVVVLCHITFMIKEEKPLALRYQSSLLVLITGFALTCSRQMMPFLPETLLDALLVSIENYAHVLFWVIALDTARSAGWPVFRAFGVGNLSCAVAGLLWSAFLEHQMMAAESAVLGVFYLSVVGCIVYPQALNREHVRTSSNETDINAFALRGEQRLDAGVNGRALQAALEQRCSNIARQYGLSDREGDVLVLLVKGVTRQNMCRDLHLSEGTVKTHLTHIYKKLGIHSQSELIDIAYGLEESKAST